MHIVLVANTILSCTMEVFKYMNGGFVVLVVGGQAVGFKKGERW